MPSNDSVLHSSSASADALSPVNGLLEWFRDNRILLSPNLRIAAGLPRETAALDVQDGQTSLRAFATTDVETDEVIASIPKVAVLSRRNCSLLYHHRPAFEAFCDTLQQDERLASSSDVYVLAVALSYELSLHQASPWYAYLRSLPSATAVGLPVQWRDEEALRWLDGTDVRGWQTHHEGDKSSLDYVCLKHATPLLAKLSAPSPDSQAGFERAYALVSSRAFWVDLYHGLSMVPLADIFNHSDHPHVSLQSDDIVCPLCGAFDECPHDDDTSAKVSTSQASSAHGPQVKAVTAASSRSSIAPDDRAHVEMLALRPVRAGEEVSNTYGTLDNARLLASYGFVLSSNDDDRVTWFSVSSVCQQAGLPTKATGAVERFWRGMLSEFTGPDDDRVSPLLPDQDDVHKEHVCKLVYVDADGALSSSLWLLLKVAFWVSQLETAGKTESDALEDLRQYVKSTEVDTVAEQVATLCTHRISLLRSHSKDLGELLDAAETHPRASVRLAIMRSVQERQLLEACRSQWADADQSGDETASSLNE